MNEKGQFSILLWEKLNELKISARNGDYKYSNTFLNFDRGDSRNISFSMSKYNSNISGKIVSLKNDVPQGDVLVS